MKKFISIIFAIALSFGVFAQSDTLFIHKGGQIISEYAVAEIDSILFFRTQATTPLPKDTVFITLPPDTVVLIDSVFITLPPDTIVRIDTVIVVHIDTATLIVTPPHQTTYDFGEAFRIAGLTIHKLSDNQPIPVTNFTLTLNGEVIENGNNIRVETAENVLSVIVNGRIVALFTITVTFCPTTTDPGVVINGVRWATRNVDMPGTFAENPESLGMFYQWGRNIGWSSTDPLINSNGGTVWNNSAISSGVWTSFNDPCPPGWRVPTRAETETIHGENVISDWTTVNGVNGRILIDINTGNSLFLPAVGWRNNNGTLNNVGTVGFYWSSASNSWSRAWVLEVNNSFMSAGTELSDNVNGLSVRCVIE